MVALLDLELLRIVPGARVMHVAPSEQAVRARLQAAGGFYLGVDLDPVKYRQIEMMKLDLCAISDHPELHGAFDIAFASHVLEHIQDDTSALKGLRRALDEHGELWIMVPLQAGPTVEDDGTLGARGRELKFGQWDHVRLYGEDLAERLAAAGLDSERLDIHKVPSDAVARSALDYREVLWRCWSA